MDYKDVLANKFNKALKEDQMLFIKMDMNPVILYEWETGSAYQARFKYLSKQKMPQQELILFLTNKYQMYVQTKETYFFLTNMQRTINLDGITIRQLTYQDETLLNDMKAQCDSADRQEANIIIYDHYVLGAFKQHELVGIASAVPLWGAYDIGVLVHPKHRKQGIAKYLINESAKWIIDHKQICMYRCNNQNISSYHCAIGVGFDKKVAVAIIEGRK